MAERRFLSCESDFFVGRRGRLRRYLVCPLQGLFPVAVRTGPTGLAVVFRTGGAHLGITGTLALATSEDGGRSFSDPVEILPRWQDNRNPAFGRTRRGTLVLGFWRAGLQRYRDDPLEGPVWTTENPPGQGEVAAFFTTRSEDGGRTWSEPRPHLSELLFMSSGYGRVLELPDGTLLMSIYGAPREPREGVRHLSVLLRSRDDGRTWGDESLVAVGYNETATCLLPDGRLLAAARATDGHVALLESRDLGRSFGPPRPVTRSGEHPADLCVLESGRLLLTFGRRIRPYGCGALISEDGGASFDREREVLLAGDGIRSVDVGYPSTVQRADGGIVTALYYASGSVGGELLGSWGEISLQALHYREEDLFGPPS